MNRKLSWLGVVVAPLLAEASARAQDCNSNGAADLAEIAAGDALDGNVNGVPDECEAWAPVPIRAQQMPWTFSYPVGIYQAPDDPTRFFVPEKDLGRIRVVHNGVLLATPFLDIDPLVAGGGERGLLGLAFHPDYARNGYFFVNYTNNSGNTVIARYRRSATNFNQADPTSAVILKTITQDFANHNGGQLQFGPDGFLYVGMGDGGSGNDPNNRAQNVNTLLGKMLRLDVDNPPTYVAEGNPFIGLPGLDEIWAVGLRNPWRFSFDRLTGDMYIGDVGQNTREEVDFQPASSTGGENYGWDCEEGFICAPGNSGGYGCVCGQAGLTDPILDIPHSDSGTCSITGGYVYRGCDLPSEHGNYFFADYCAGYVRSFRYEPGDPVPVSWTNRRPELSGIVGLIVSFGEDLAGEHYIVTSSGNIYRIARQSEPECGNALLEAGEQCDPPDGVTCDASCQAIGCVACTDCNSNGVTDAAELAAGSAADCNSNGVLDECDIASGTSSDCTGGPIGNVAAGEATFFNLCSACHGASGSGGAAFPGPDVRNRTRDFLWSRLRWSGTHTGGDYPELAVADYANIEAYLSDVGARPRGDQVPDECQSDQPDCDSNGVPDGCDLAAGNHVDRDFDGLADDVCETYCGTAPGDGDGDCDFDLVDYGSLQRCWTESGTGGTILFAFGCGCFDADIDGDVDLTDFALVGEKLTGPGGRLPECPQPQ
jgi:glucose/arabinose dehydrogenase/mono/diheme cytochrome c family protein